MSQALHPHYPTQHFLNTFADVFADIPGSVFRKKNSDSVGPKPRLLGFLLGRAMRPKPSGQLGMPQEANFDSPGLRWNGD